MRKNISLPSRVAAALLMTTMGARAAWADTTLTIATVNNGFCEGSTIELDAVTLPASGTYTVLVGDCSDTLTGNYVIYMQRTNNPSGVTMLLFGHTQTSNIASAAQSQSYVFSGAANDVVDFPG